MVYYVYLIKTLDNFFNKSYVGYTNKKRLEKHNTNLGKSTKGYKWQLNNIKNKALSFEYKLKKDRNERSKLIKNFNKKI